MQNNIELPEKLYERSDRGAILYIRHAQSKFNLDTRTIITEDEAKHSKEYLDAKLTETGIEQAENLSRQINSLKIKYVFCSPMLRCLQTCFYSLKNHPQKEQIKVLVHPLITETVNCNHDFSRSVKLKKQLFGLESEVKFDWSVFDFYFPEENSQESFFVDYIDCLLEDENVKGLFDKLRHPEAFKDNELMDSLKIELNLLYAKKKIRPESIKRMFLRNLEFKEYLNKFFKENGHPWNIKEEKVLVYTHSNYIQTANSKMAYGLEKMDHFPEDSYKPLNCEVISIFLN